MRYEMYGVMQLIWGKSNVEIIGTSTPLHMLMINESHLEKTMPKVFSPD